MTKAQHLQWVRERAMQEYNYYAKKQGHTEGVSQAIASAVSDLGKHTETHARQRPFMLLALMRKRALTDRAVLKQFLEQELT